MHAFACGVLRPARQHDRSQLLHISSMAFHGLLDVDSKDIAEYLARAWAGLLQAGILEVVEK